MANYDHIIVGAGVIGSWTAYHLTSLGRKVCLLDQYPLPHSRGSSQGQSRMLRSEHTDPDIAKLYWTTNLDWKKLQEESGEQILVRTGRLSVAKAVETKIGRTESTKETVEHLNSEELMKRFPGTRWSSEFSAVYHPEVQMVVPNKSMVALRSAVVSKGGHLVDSAVVTDIIPGADKVAVCTTRGNYTGESVVICAGPWSKELLARNGIHVPLETNTVPVCYWKQTKPGMYDASAGFPVFRIDEPEDEAKFFHFFYGCPCYEYPDLVKICLSTGIPSNPDARDQVEVADTIREVQRMIIKHFPYVDATPPPIVERCVQSVSSDGRIIIDSDSHHKNVVFGCGLSGIGFQTGPAVGRVLAYLASGDRKILGKMANNIESFSMKRFGEKQCSKL